MAEGQVAAHAESVRLTQPYETIWTRLVIDPIAVPVARFLAAYRGVTPNRVTLVAGALGVGAAACFASGLLRIGGALFLLRYFVDCLDGKIARLQRTTSQRGAALDQIVDIAGIVLNFAALAMYLVSHGYLPPAVAFGIMAAVALFSWLVAYRKQLAERAGMPDGGGAGGRLRTTVPVLRNWASWCERKDMMPIPYSVEAETTALGLLPLFGSPALAAVGLWLALCFYVPGAILNARRVWRIAGALDPVRLRDPTSVGAP